MKAFLLAAGYGTRLRPLTDTVPKCMVPIRGKPLLEWWFELLLRHGVTDVLVNTHYLPGPVRSFLAEYDRRRTGLTAVEAYEPELLGSGGTVWHNRAFVQGEDSFLICYADNLTSADLTALLRFHETRGGALTMALFHSDHPEACGIASLAEDGRITAFEEKPARPRGDLANAGIYAAGSALFGHFPDAPFIDFGRDVLPGLVGSMFGYELSDRLIDIGTPEHYRRANEEWGT